MNTETATTSKTNGTTDSPRHQFGSGSDEADPIHLIEKGREGARAELHKVDARSRELRLALGLPVLVEEGKPTLPEEPTPAPLSRTVAKNDIRPAKVERGVKTGAPKKSGRLARRSEEGIASLLTRIHETIMSHGSPMRAEQIRKALDVDAKELPRVLKAGLDGKTLTSKGDRRATEYSVKLGPVRTAKRKAKA